MKSLLLLLSIYCLAAPLEAMKLNTSKINIDTDKFFKARYKSQKAKQAIESRKLRLKYEPMYTNQKLERELIPGDPSSEEGNEVGLLLGQTMGGTMSLSLADTPKVVMVNQAPFYSYL